MRSSALTFLACFVMAAVGLSTTLTLAGDLAYATAFALLVTITVAALDRRA